MKRTIHTLIGIALAGLLALAVFGGVGFGQAAHAARCVPMIYRSC